MLITAIISPFYDIEYNPQPPQVFTFGDGRCRVSLPSGQSYSSFALLPLLTFATRRKCLFVGGPGRGKTASAVLMGVLAGYTLNEVRRGIQKGQPQMTVADLLGAPLPSALMQASRLDQVAVGWRSWLEMRVKIIDEYNRIPTRTQSALLTLMADNYAELFDQTYECPDSAWFPRNARRDARGRSADPAEAEIFASALYELPALARVESWRLIPVQPGVFPSNGWVLGSAAESTGIWHNPKAPEFRKLPDVGDGHENCKRTGGCGSRPVIRHAA